MKPYTENYSRRKFIGSFGLTLGAGAALANAKKATINKAWTVGEIMDLFIKEVPGAPFGKTVDTIKSGSRDNEVSGIVTTMFPTINLINKTIELGANLIIAHEPTFYNGQDETSWLSESEVFKFKTELLRKNNITIWRNHDYVHGLVNDGVRAGVLDQLGWSNYYKSGTTLEVPLVTLGNLITHIKTKMDVPSLRYSGDLAQQCKKILLLPGAYGGRRQIESLIKEKPDVLICGETVEWETPEYVRDANAKGDKLSLIVIGHSASEEAGSEFMAAWLKKNVPGVSVTHLASNNSLAII